MRCAALLPVSVVAVLLSGCDSGDNAAATPDLFGPAMVAIPHAGWGPASPVSGGADLNTSALEGCPNESPDGQSLFFASNRGGDIDIYVSRRGRAGEWGTPTQLPRGPDSVNSDANDYCPTALPGGGLLFVSERADGLNCGIGTADIYISREHPAHGWLAPEHLGCVVNSPANEFAPSLVSAGGGMLFFSSNRGVDNRHAIYVSHRGPRGEWQAPVAVDELNAAGYSTFRPNASQDGREIVFDSDRPPSVATDIWYSRRTSIGDQWSPPVRLSDDHPNAINSAFSETRASLSRDGKRIYFGSNRTVGASFDIFVAERR